MFRVSAIACSSATDFFFSSAISTCVQLRVLYGGRTPGVGGGKRWKRIFWGFEGCGAIVGRDGRAVQCGGGPKPASPCLADPPHPRALVLGTYPSPPDFVRAWATGLSFSAPLVAILLCHELGHYLTARHYQLDVSPPYFIPVPLVPWSIGTMGAFIRLRTVVSDRRQLLDVGIAGPIAGLLVAVPVLWLGLRLSHALPGQGSETGMLLAFGSETAGLGDSLITLALRRLLFGAAPAILLHPVAFAGWLGVFVTMLNLLPISQLDGGHILYSALPRWHRRVALGFWVLVVALGALWKGWLLWGGLVLLLSRGRLGHPPVLDGQRPLPRSRSRLAWAALLLFLVTFTPVPFRL